MSVQWIPARNTEKILKAAGVRGGPMPAGSAFAIGDQPRRRWRNLSSGFSSRR